jgi:predicted alpha/beta hydrolase
LWQAQQARAVVLLHPATAVTQSYYHAFAAYLSGLGLHVLTYDYRGTGRSIAGHVRDCKVTMADWMEQDVGAVTRRRAFRRCHCWRWALAWVAMQLRCRRRRRSCARR